MKISTPSYLLTFGPISPQGSDLPDGVSEKCFMSVVRVAGRVWQGCRDTPTLLTTQSRQSTRLANEVLRTTANDP